MQAHHVRLILPLLFFLSLVVNPPALLAQTEALTVPRPLDQLVRESATIVHATVVSAKVEPHPQLRNLNTVLVTLNVSETLKGTAGKQLQFRQYIWNLRDRLDKTSYQKGEELVLLLGPTSQYGLTSPVGLEQGRFRIVRSKGSLTATNGRGNAGLFDGTQQRARAQHVRLSTTATKAVQQATATPLALTDLESVIRSFAGGAQ